MKTYAEFIEEVRDIANRAHMRDSRETALSIANQLFDLLDSLYEEDKEKE